MGALYKTNIPCDCLFSLDQGFAARGEKAETMEVSRSSNGVLFTCSFFRIKDAPSQLISHSIKANGNVFLEGAVLLPSALVFPLAVQAALRIQLGFWSDLSQRNPYSAASHLTLAKTVTELKEVTATLVRQVKEARTLMAVLLNDKQTLADMAKGPL